MVITDTPGTAFDKIALDVVGPLFKTKSDKSTFSLCRTKSPKFA